MARKYSATEVNGDKKQALFTGATQREFDDWFSRNSKAGAIRSWSITRYDRVAKDMNIIRTPGVALLPLRKLGA